MDCWKYCKVYKFALSVARPRAKKTFSFRGASPPNSLTRGSDLGPRWGLCPQTPVKARAPRARNVPPKTAHGPLVPVLWRLRCSGEKRRKWKGEAKGERKGGHQGGRGKEGRWGKGEREEVSFPQQFFKCRHLWAGKQCQGGFGKNGLQYRTLHSLAWRNRTKCIQFESQFAYLCIVMCGAVLSLNRNYKYG